MLRLSSRLQRRARSRFARDSLLSIGRHLNISCQELLRLSRKVKRILRVRGGRTGDAGSGKKELTTAKAAGSIIRNVKTCYRWTAHPRSCCTRQMLPAGTSARAPPDTAMWRHLLRFCQLPHCRLSVFLSSLSLLPPINRSGCRFPQQEMMKRAWKAFPDLFRRRRWRCRGVAHGRPPPGHVANLWGPVGGVTEPEPSWRRGECRCWGPGRCRCRHFRW